MRARPLILPVCVSFLTLATVGCSHSADSADTVKTSVADVTLTKVERGDISDVLTLSGTVSASPNNDIRVSSLVAGRIAEMKLAEGDHVTTGELLAQIDARPYQDQLTQAEAAIAQAKANLENATASRNRNEDLFQRGIAARKDAGGCAHAGERGAGRIQAGNGGRLPGQVAGGTDGCEIAAGWNRGQTLCECG